MAAAREADAVMRAAAATTMVAATALWRWSGGAPCCPAARSTTIGTGTDFGGGEACTGTAESGGEAVSSVGLAAGREDTVGGGGAGGGGAGGDAVAIVAGGGGGGCLAAAHQGGRRLPFGCAPGRRGFVKAGGRVCDEQTLVIQGVAANATKAEPVAAPSGPKANWKASFR